MDVQLFHCKSFSEKNILNLSLPSIYLQPNIVSNKFKIIPVLLEVETTCLHQKDARNIRNLDFFFVDFDGKGTSYEDSSRGTSRTSGNFVVYFS